MVTAVTSNATKVVASTTTISLRRTERVMLFSTGSPRRNGIGDGEPARTKPDPGFFRRVQGYLEAHASVAHQEVDDAALSGAALRFRNGENLPVARGAQDLRQARILLAPDEEHLQAVQRFTLLHAFDEQGPAPHAAPGNDLRERGGDVVGADDP